MQGSLIHTITYRTGTNDDIEQLVQLGIQSWSRFKPTLTEDNWQKLINNVSNPNTYTELLSKSHCFICTHNEQIIGMAFLMYSGTAFDVYEANWCSIRFVIVHTDYNGKGIGKQLTQLCIGKAKELDEKTIALHTSEIMPDARHIYESLGFSILKEINPRFGKRYWLYTMEIQ
jgi:ribosomal protein S18 acetylase RimI-like enzyme